MAMTAQAQEPAVGDFLVATPAIRGSGFAETVVLVLQHDEHGTMGLVINRPLAMSPADALPDVTSLDNYQGPLFAGGPVAPGGVLLLLRADEQPPGALPVSDDIWASGDVALVAALGAGGATATRVRLYAGHAGWKPGQLAAEIDRGSWTVMPGRSELVFAAEPDRVWRTLRGIAVPELVRGH